eukprot:TRINITY_DN89913_c0_g1_i1.p1 TRINITY_DN89913_c0_g1~~TRINITY_DN89913_c0_g1_i1.p1  ORF type:complete len:362 (-),score=49.58 TRINITY_DN89913_c0_g1_i1:329-1414(-)
MGIQGVTFPLQIQNMSKGSTLSVTPCFVGVGSTYETSIVDYISSTLQETAVKSKLNVQIGEEDSNKVLDLLVKGLWCNETVAKACLGEKAWKKAAAQYHTERDDTIKKATSFIDKTAKEGAALIELLIAKNSSVFTTYAAAEEEIGRRCLKAAVKHIECDLILTSKKEATGTARFVLGIDQIELVHPFMAVFEITSDPQQAAAKLFQLEKDLAYLSVKGKLSTYKVYPLIITNGGVTTEDVIKAQTESLTAANLSLNPITNNSRFRSTLVGKNLHRLVYTKHLNIYELEKSIYGKINSIHGVVSTIEKDMKERMEKMEGRMEKMEEGMKDIKEKMDKIEEGIKKILEKQSGQQDVNVFDRS